MPVYSLQFGGAYRLRLRGCLGTIHSTTAPKDSPNVAPRIAQPRLIQRSNAINPYRASLAGMWLVSHRPKAHPSSRPTHPLTRMIHDNSRQRSANRFHTLPGSRRGIVLHPASRPSPNGRSPLTILAFAPYLIILGKRPSRHPSRKGPT